MDVIAELGRQAAIQSSGSMEKVAINWAKGAQFAKNILASPFTKQVGGARKFAPGRTAATLGGLAAGGYGTYGGVEGVRTARGAYDAPTKTNGVNDYSDTSGWRRAGRQAGTRSTFMDLIKNPGRTISEGLGYGKEGPQYQYGKAEPGAVLREYVDPRTGERKVVHGPSVQKRTWRPDVQKKRTDAASMLTAMQKAHGGEVFQGMDLPSSLGQRASRLAYPRLAQPGAVRNKYDIYNYGAGF